MVADTFISPQVADHQWRAYQVWKARMYKVTNRYRRSQDGHKSEESLVHSPESLAGVSS